MHNIDKIGTQNTTDTGVHSNGAGLIATAAGIALPAYKINPMEPDKETFVILL